MTQVITTARPFGIAPAPVTAAGDDLHGIGTAAVILRALVSGSGSRHLVRFNGVMVVKMLVAGTVHAGGPEWAGRANPVVVAAWSYAFTSNAA